MRLFRELGDALKAGFLIHDILKNGYVVRKPDPPEMGVVDQRGRRQLPEIEDSIHLHFYPKGHVLPPVPNVSDGEDQC